MKKLIYILVFFLAFSQAKATSYYWIGGTSDTAFARQKSWTIDPVGRASVGATGSIAIGLTDVFIFDGTNIGGIPAVTGAVSITMSSLTATPFAQLKFINGANVSLGRSTAGSSAIIIAGDGTSAPDFVIDATSSLTIGSLLANANVQISLDSTKAASALISGKFYISPLSKVVHTRSYITSKVAGSLVFASGSECHITDSTTSSGFNGSLEGCIVFQSGSSLYYYTGRSPVGSSSSLQMSYFQPGSNLYFRGSNISYVDGITVYSTSSWTNTKTLANVFVQNGSTFSADGPCIRMENFTVDAGCTYNCYKSGQTPIMGNLTVNGTMTFVSPSSNSILMGGNAIQTISGTGTIYIPSFYVCDNSTVTLSKTIKDSVTTSILGKIDFGANGIITGTSGFSSKVAGTPTSFVGNTTAGSYVITGVVGTITGITGFTVSGSGVPSNTNTVAFSGTGASITMSQPATATATGVTFNFTSNAATLTTANPNGFDSTSGCVTVTGAKTYQSGTNYVINAATVHPIGISSSAPAGMSVGNLTLNAPVTTNYKKINVQSTLTLNSGKFTLRPADTLVVVSGNDIAGAPFSAAKYIVTDNNGTDVAELRIDSFTNIKTFPVGTATDYLPLTLAPQTYGGFNVSVFKGVTANATPSGTAFTTAQKAGLADAVWNIVRNKGTGVAALNLNWTSGLEGSVFSSLPNNQIGIASFNGTTWGIPAAISADNVANIANDTFSTFKSFAVGQVGNVLPVQFRNLSATLVHNIATVNWQIANESTDIQYFVEKSNDGITFSTVGLVHSLNNASSVNAYNFTDASLFNGNNYYRIRIVSADGTAKYSNVLLVKNNSKINVQVYPNPVKAGNPMTVSFNAASSSDISIRIMDMAGKLISTRNSIVNQGQNVISVPTDSNIKTGNYIISILSGNNATESITVPVIIK